MFSFLFLKFESFVFEMLTSQEITKTSPVATKGNGGRAFKMQTAVISCLQI